MADALAILGGDGPMPDPRPAGAPVEPVRAEAPGSNVASPCTHPTLRGLGCASCGVYRRGCPACERCVDCLARQARGEPAPVPVQVPI